MKNFKSLILVVLAIILVFNPVNAQASNKYKNSVFEVLTDVEYTHKSGREITITKSGTAFYIGNKTFVTAYHCVTLAPDQEDYYDEDEQIRYKFKKMKTYISYNNGKKSLSVKTITHDPEQDVSTLVCKTVPKSFKALELFWNEVEVDEAVSVYGFPIWGTNYLEGIVEGYEDVYTYIGFYPDNIRTTLACTGGHSGSPVFNSDGLVVGVVAAGDEVAKTWVTKIKNVAILEDFR